MTEHFLLRASAGTGKTYQLVSHYCSLLENHGLKPQDIVAITFTRKAAGEMRARIRKRLLEKGATPQLAAELENAPIETFHSLCLKLLQKLGVSAGFSGGTGLLGDNDADLYLFRRACENAWFGSKPGSSIGRAVSRLAHQWSIGPSLYDALWGAISRAREEGRSVDDVSQLIVQHDVDAMRTRVHNELRGVRYALEQSAATADAAMRDKHFAAALALPWSNVEHDVAIWHNGWQDYLSSFKLQAGFIKNIINKDERERLRDDLKNCLAEAHLAQSAPDIELLVGSAWKTYQHLKDREQMWDFADLITRLAEVLENDKELHVKVRQNIAALLVDEAQDTNALQSKLVRLLAGLNGPAAHPDRVASLFVVGDWKQSIYTFRGADPASFASFADEIARLGGQSETLTVSRRSTPGVVRGINHLGLHLLGDTYEPLAALEEDDGKSIAWQWIDVPYNEEVTKPSDARAEAEAIAQSIAEQIAAGRAPRDFAILTRAKSAMAMYQRALADVGVPAIVGGGAQLFEQREVRDIVALIEWVCNPRDVLAAAVALRSPMIGISDGALLHYFTHPEQDVVVSDGHDAWALQHLQKTLSDMRQAAQVMLPSRFIDYLDGLWHFRTIYQSLPDGAQRLANVDRISALAADFERQGRGGVACFAQYIRERMNANQDMSAAVPYGHTPDAVTLLTIHKSKGLQYPIVILGDISRKSPGVTEDIMHVPGVGWAFKMQVQQHKAQSLTFKRGKEQRAEAEDAELKRLLYVAVTRAQEAVWIFYRQVMQNTADGAQAISAKHDKCGAARYLVPWVGTAVHAGVLQRRMFERLPVKITEHASDVAYHDITPPAVNVHEIVADGVVSLPVTQLETYMQCLRQGYFKHDLRIDEQLTLGESTYGAPSSDETRPDAATPDASAAAFVPAQSDGELDGSLDPMSRGRLAHGILAAIEGLAHASSLDAFIDAELARAGFDPKEPRLSDIRADVSAFILSPLGRRIVAKGSANLRPELPFQLSVPGRPRVLLNGQMDLLMWDDGAPVVVDYKHARRNVAALSTYNVQLDAYAAASAQLCGYEGPVRTMLVFLRDRRAPLLREVTVAMQQEFLGTVARIGREVVAQRHAAVAWQGRERSDCEALECTFLRRCHGA